VVFGVVSCVAARSSARWADTLDRRSAAASSRPARGCRPIERCPSGSGSVSTCRARYAEGHAPRAESAGTVGAAPSCCRAGGRPTPARTADGCGTGATVSAADAAWRARSTSPQRAAVRRTDERLRRALEALIGKRDLNGLGIINRCRDSSSIAGGRGVAAGARRRRAGRRHLCRVRRADRPDDHLPSGWPGRYGAPPRR